jgi:flagellar basal-body rod protein FlgC
MPLFDGFRISVSGMDAQLRRLRTIASNLANVNSTASASGQVYRRKDVVFAPAPLDGQNSPFSPSDPAAQRVSVVKVVEDPRPLKSVFMPGHPDADEQGFVQFPNVEPFEEVVHMMDALRSYEANIATFNASKDMMKKALEIGR